MEELALILIHEKNDLHRVMRLANIRTDRGPALGVEPDRGVLNVCATGEALGLQAPMNIDELLHRGMGGQLEEICLQALPSPKIPNRAAWRSKRRLELTSMNPSTEL